MIIISNTNVPIHELNGLVGIELNNVAEQMDFQIDPAEKT